jgi:DNA-directed RNA polymerase subunit RPC12/RpoP
VAKAVAKELPFELISDEWYLRYKCVNCKTTHVLFRDLTRGTAAIKATYFIECPTCSVKEAYDGRNIERYHYQNNHT